MAVIAMKCPEIEVVVLDINEGAIVCLYPRCSLYAEPAGALATPALLQPITINPRLSHKALRI
jgi:hypothetical protein